MHRTAEHRAARVFADDRLRLGDLDAWQQRGFLVQIIGHRREARRNDPAGVVARRIDDIERHRRAEIDHHHRRAEPRVRRDGVGQPVRADRRRLRVVNADAGHRPRRELPCRTLPAPAQKPLERRVEPGHHAAKHRTGEPAGLGQAQQFGERLLRLAKHERLAGKPGIGHDALAVGHGGVSVRVANINEQNHGGMSYHTPGQV